MRRRWNANTWLLVILLVIIGVTAIELFRGAYMIREAQKMPEITKEAKAPEFERGQLAPDFSLPDKSGKPRRLSDLVKRDTMIFFICGCANCRNTQGYLGQLQERMGEDAPDVISISTTQPDAEEAYRRDVKLHGKHTILYERGASPADKAVLDQYQGHPCPRFFRVEHTRMVGWISPSPAVDPDMSNFVRDMAKALGFASSATADKSQRVAPVPRFITEGMSGGSMGAPVAAPMVPGSTTAHGPGDGHGHGPGDGHGH